MWEKFQKLLDRAESRLALYLAIGGSSVAAALTAWIASYSVWVSQFGHIGWWITGLVGALLVALVALCSIQLRFAWVRSKAIRDWQDATDSFNPMDRDFYRLRIRISALADPIANRISDKNLTDCDLIGPANIAFLKGCRLSHVRFTDCDVVAAKPDAIIKNAIGIENVTMTGGRIARATMIISDEMVPMFEAMGASIINYRKPQ